MKSLKVLKREKKQKSFTNKFQMDPKTKFQWELLEENEKLKKRKKEKQKMEEKIEIEKLFKTYDQDKLYVDMDFYKRHGWITLKKEIEDDD